MKNFFTWLMLLLAVYVAFLFVGDYPGKVDLIDRFFWVSYGMWFYVLNTWSLRKLI